MKKLAVLLYASLLMASGFQLSGTGARELQLGGSDIVNPTMWTAPFWNPALVAKKSENQMGLFINTVGLQGMYVMNTGLLGYDGGYRLQDTVVSKKLVYPIPGLGIVRNVEENFQMGFIEFSPFGLGGKWNLYEFPLGYYNTTDTAFKKPEFPEDNWHSDLRTFALFAAMAYRLSNRLRVGFSGGPILASVKLGKVTFIDPAKFDTAALSLPIQYRLMPVTLDINANDAGYGINIGVAYKITSCLSAGAVFRYYSTLEFIGDAKFALYLPKNDLIAQHLDSSSQYLMSGEVVESEGDVTAPFKLPYELAFGVGYNKNNLGIYTSITYTKWSRFDEIVASFRKVKLLNTPIEKEIIPENFKDTYKFAFGVEYGFTPNLDARIGFYYDQSPVPDTTLTPLIPDINTKLGLNLGAGAKINQQIKLYLGTEYVYTKDKNVPRDMNFSYASPYMPGTYKLNIMATNLSIVYSF